MCLPMLKSHTAEHCVICILCKHVEKTIVNRLIQIAKICAATFQQSLMAQYLMFLKT